MSDGEYGMVYEYKYNGGLRKIKEKKEEEGVKTKRLCFNKVFWW